MNAYLQGYRTYVVAALVGIFGALAALDWTTILADPKAGAALVVSSILMAVMRSFTTTPPGKAPTAPGSTMNSHAWLGIVVVTALMLSGCAETLKGASAADTALKIGAALYQVECRAGPLPGLIGAGVVASIRAPDSAAARRVRAAVDVNNALVANVCPAATAIEVVVGRV